MNNAIHCNIHLLLMYFDGIYLLESWCHNLIAKLLWFVTKIFLKFHIVLNKLKSTFRCHSTIARIANIKKWQQMSNPLLVGVQTSVVIMEISVEVSQREKIIVLPYDPAIALLRVYLKESIYYYRDYCPASFCGFIFNNQELKQPMYLSTNE